MDYIEVPSETLTHIKSDVRATTWCGRRYNIGTVVRPERPNRPLCKECMYAEAERL